MVPNDFTVESRTHTHTHYHCYKLQHNKSNECQQLQHHKLGVHHKSGVHHKASTQQILLQHT